MRAPISRFTVSGNSMQPTLKEGQDILSINWFVNPKVGDIIVIKKQGKEMVKRIEKIEGENVFVVGDNEDESTDSRHFGAIKRELIIGKVIYQSNEVPCHNCEAPIIGVAGRKDAICRNCGFKLTCCGEP
jgi:signal peptidase I